MTDYSSPRRTFWDEPLTPQDFQKPAVQFGLAPFWFWNGDMNENTIREQVHAMAEAGVAGFFIHPRQGMTLPYLSDEYFERIRVVVEEAAKLGLEAWLYDEYPYPSGIAAGLLTANRPDIRARVLQNRTFEIQNGEEVRFELPLGRLVSALAVPVENGELNWDAAIDVRSKCGVVFTREQFWYWPMGHIPYNEKRFMADEGRLVLTWTPSQGSWKIFASIECEQRGHKYFDYYFDPIHPDAAPEFIRLTHERYAATVGEFFGNTIPGIFTDETEPPLWSPELESATGLDMSVLAPALKEKSHPKYSEVQLQWRETALRLFIERWETPIADWCREHNLIWAAEKPTWRPAQFAGIAQPSTDAGHHRIDLAPEPLFKMIRANHRVAMASAEQNGTEEVRCECFHSLGWGATLQDQKWSIDYMGAQGVNRFTPHAFYYTSSGIVKHDAAPSFFHENPYWAHFRALSDYTARLGIALSRGRERAPIAILHPTKTVWSGKNVNEAEDTFEKITTALLNAHYGFHPTDALALTVAKGENGVLTLGRAKYHTLVIPPYSEGDEEIVATVQQALAAGVRVIAFDSFSGTEQVSSVEELLTQLESGRELSINDSENHEITSIWAVNREAGEQQLLFLTNTSAAPVKANIKIKTSVTRFESWNMEDGKVAPKAVNFESGWASFELELPAFGSALLVGDNQISQVLVDASTRKIQPLPLDGLWNLSLDEPNALRLNRWLVSSDDPIGVTRSDFDDSDWREIEALPLRHIDKRQAKDIELCPREDGATVWYRRTIKSEFVSEDLEILIENGAIHGDWTLFVNGEKIPASAFKPRTLHGTDKISCAIAAFWKRGKNVLTLQVEKAPIWGGLKTPLHLVGSFAVRDRELVSLPSESPFNDLDSAGLPHFAGTVRYRRQVNASGFAEADALTLPIPFEDIAEVKVNGNSLGVRPWSPYVWDLPTDALPSTGEVEIEVVVTGTLLRFVEGRVWNAIEGKRLIV